MSNTELVERLERLERDNRRLKGFAIAALALAVALTTIYATQPVPQRVTAHEFDVVDSSGRARVSMGMALGEPSVSLSDAQGKVRAEMSIGPSGGPSICLTDAEGQPRVSMGIASRNVFISIYDAAGNGRASMGFSPSGGPVIGVSDAQDKSAIAMGLNPEGELGLTFQAAKDRASVDIHVAPSGSPRIEFLDQQGFRMVLGSAQTVTARTGETQQASTASIIMFGNDREHHVIWKAP
jgi:hypothetical protein